MSYRPITDLWLLARPKVKYYGAYPSGFLDRARALLGVSIAEPVLHVCGGRVRTYPFGGFGPNDRTLDLDPAMQPDFLRDAREPFPMNSVPRMALEGIENDPAPWPAILIDPPYTESDADKYVPGPKALPTPDRLLRNAFGAVREGGRIGMLHYNAPGPSGLPLKLVAMVGVIVGFNNRARLYSVYEKRAAGASAAEGEHDAAA